MPAVPLTAPQISDVVAFLHAQLEASDKTSPRSPGADYSLERLLTGNAQAGKEYFNGAGRCSTCHSATGDLAGIAKKYAPPELQAKFLFPDPDRVSAATVTLPSGEKVKGDLVYKDAFDVAIQNATGRYHSWPLSQVKVEVRDPLAAHIRFLSKLTEAEMHNLFAYLETLK